MPTPQANREHGVRMEILTHERARLLAVIPWDLLSAGMSHNSDMKRQTCTLRLQVLCAVLGVVSAGPFLSVNLQRLVTAGARNST